MPRAHSASAAPSAAAPTPAERRWPRRPPRACARSEAASPSSSYCDRECSLGGWRQPLPGAGVQRPPVVALGKFDAMHKGHRALAAAAAEAGGAPWLVSFAGMAEVLGWPPRLPLVAPADRRRVLDSWAGACGGLPPQECSIPFREVREMSPEAFVALLAQQLRVEGVVVGANYRFGYRAAGTADTLRQLGPRYGLQVHVLGLVELRRLERLAPDQPVVSSSAVRAALAAGDVHAVADCLGRRYRLVLLPPHVRLPPLPQSASRRPAAGHGRRKDGPPVPPELRFYSAECANQPPGPGRYRAFAQPLAGAVAPPAGPGAGQEVEVEVSEDGQVAVLGWRGPGLAEGAGLALDFDVLLA